MRWTARVHATDNYEAVVAWGEFDPGYEGKQILLAYEDNGQLLTQDGIARLVVPGDLHGGRYVSNVNAVAFDPPADHPEGWLHVPCRTGTESPPSRSDESPRLGPAR